MATRIAPLLLERAREMRHEPAPAEKKIWACLRNRQLSNLKFRRQMCVGPFIADFYCAELLLIVELDGDSHAERLAYDADRTKWLEKNGCRVIRFFNHHVQTNLIEVLEAILSEAELIRGKKKDPHPNPPPGVPGGGDQIEEV